MDKLKDHHDDWGEETPSPSFLSTFVGLLRNDGGGDLVVVVFVVVVVECSCASWISIDWRRDGTREIRP